MPAPIVARLQKPLERAISGGHPWIYRDALAPFRGAPGAVATVLDRRGRFLARGLCERGPIAVRVFTTRDEPVDAALIGRRLGAAHALRARLVPPDTDAYRVVHGEGDRLPGIVCDRYAAHAIVRYDGEASLTLREGVEEHLRELLARDGVTGLSLRSGRGETRRLQPIWGERAERVAVREHGMTLLCDLVHGQKTGLFLDHRGSRRRVREIAAGHRVLDLYAYVGGFSVAAGLGGAADVTSVDVAAGALGLAEQAWATQGLPAGRHSVRVADVESFLRDASPRFSLVIADPPSFAPRAASVPAAERAYRALHGAVLRVLEREGLYLAASCSSHIDRPTFEETLRAAAHTARRRLQLLERWGAGPDHPSLLGFPEGDYLKVVLVRALD